MSDEQASAGWSEEEQSAAEDAVSGIEPRARRIGPPTRAESSNSFDHRPWREAFLYMYSQTGNITASANAAGVNRSTVKRWQRDDPKFAALMAEARQTAIDVLYGALFERAIQTDTTAAIFLLKNLDPQQFNERRKIEYEVSGKVEVDHSLGLAELRETVKVLLATGQLRLEDLIGGEGPGLLEDGNTIEGEAREV